MTDIHTDWFRFVSFVILSICFVPNCCISFHFVSFRFVSFRFVSFCFVSLRFVLFRFVSFRFVLFRFASFYFVSIRIVSCRFDDSLHRLHGTYELKCPCTWNCADYCTLIAVLIMYRYNWKLRECCHVMLSTAEAVLI